MTGDPDTFRQGAAAFRNGRDWAERERDKATNEANEREVQCPITAAGRGLSLSFESDVYADETIIKSQNTVLEPIS
ncbi:hypothetical protein QQS21_008781 [Conoideocrella luteorostrata]|uniref:Uncharacterized protein n=1 Tax=Conoideocrella luteorostrata TaxID=1105319 RepID=A0AAJ0CIG4_9HYPO|nr:hypothetical protein QQS21_008781 [Conoideocrella luteorostrata]